MNIPFVEHRVITIVVNEYKIQWMELSRVGTKVSVVQEGEYTYNGAQVNRINFFKEIKQHIQGDVYKVVCVCPTSILSVQSIEIPFFDSQEQIDQWSQTYVEEEKAKFNENEVVTKLHVSQIDEELSQLSVQVVNKHYLESIIEELLSVGLHVESCFSGATEASYSMALSENFNDGFYGVIQVNENIAILCIFNNGLLQSMYSLSSSDLEADHILSEADSILKSEEQKRQIELGSSTIFTNQISKIEISRPIKHLEAYTGVSSADDVKQQYLMCFGSGIKSFYTGLDSFDFVNERNQKESNKNYDRQVFRKVSVLLGVPLIVFFLCIYVWNSIASYQLKETSQVMGAIETKLELVEQTRSEVDQLYNHYKDVEGLLDQKTNTTKIFTLINETIHSSITLNAMRLEVHEGKKSKFIIEGFVSERSKLSEFMKRLTAHAWTTSVQLTSSSQKSENEQVDFTILIGVDIW